MFSGRPPRHTAHDMNSEFESKAVDMVGQWFEACPICGGRKSIDGGCEPAESVHGQHGIFSVVEAIGSRLIPLSVDRKNVVAMGQQLRRHDLRRGPGLILPNGGREAVP